MTLSNLSLTSTFTDQMNRIDQMLVIINNLTDGITNSTGAIYITNASGVRGNVSLELANGMFKGDGGLISNITLAALTTSTINVVSNSASINIGTGTSTVVSLGGKVFINVATSTGTSDNSSANLTTANITNSIYTSLVTANATAIQGLSTAIAAFAVANTGGGSLALAQAAFTQANTGSSLAQAAFGAANNANIEAQGAFSLAQSAYSVANSAGAGAFTLAQTAYGQANTGTTLAQAAFAEGNAAFSLAQAAFAEANTGGASNPVTLTIGATTNADLNTGVNFYLLLTQNTTLNITNTKVQSGFIQIQQNATGNWAVQWSNPPIKFSGNVKPVITRTPNANDIFFYSVINGAFVLGSIVPNVS